MLNKSKWETNFDFATCGLTLKKFQGIQNGLLMTQHYNGKKKSSLSSCKKCFVLHFCFSFNKQATMVSIIALKPNYIGLDIRLTIKTTHRNYQRL